MKRLQFSLASLLLLVVIAALGLALYRARKEVQDLKSQVAEAARRETAAIAQIKDTVARANEIARRARENTQERDEIAGKQRETTLAAKKQLTEVIERLIDGLRHESPAVRYWAADWLRQFGDHAKLAVPALLQAKNDPDKKVREAAERALKVIDRDEPEATVN